MSFVVRNDKDSQKGIKNISNPRRRTCRVTYIFEDSGDAPNAQDNQKDEFEIYQLDFDYA